MRVMNHNWSATKQHLHLHSVTAHLVLLGTLKPRSNGPLYRNTVIGTLAVDWWAVTLGTAMGAWVGCGPAQSPPRCTKFNSPPINGQCTNFILFDVTKYLYTLKS